MISTKSFEIFTIVKISKASSILKFAATPFNLWESIVKLSNIVPYQRLIGWDFSIDETGTPVFIELNIGQGSWMYQIATGKPLFGKYSLEVKEYLDSL